MPIPVIPSVDVCLSCDLQRILLVHHARTFDSDGFFRGNLPFAEPSTFTLDRFEGIGVKSIRESFEEFGSRLGKPDSECGALSKKAMTALFRDHRVVGISLQESGVWHLGPLHHRQVGRSGGSGPEDSSIWVPSERTKQFFRLLWFSFGCADLPTKRSKTAIGSTDHLS